MPTYEVVPSDKLPLLDLSRSVGGELCGLAVRFGQWHGGHVADTSAPRRLGHNNQFLHDADAPLQRLLFYRITLWAFAIGTLFGTIACVVPKAAGVGCAVLGLVLVLPFSLLSILHLRFDMVKLLLTTYDCWFYSLVNTIGAVLLSASFADARACVAMILWIGNTHTVLIDANTQFICHLNIVSVGVVMLSVVIMLAIETKSIDAWHARTFRIRTNHEDSIETDNLISNALTTMTVIVLRNAYRRHTELIQQVKIDCPMLRCINYRCRIKPVAADSKRQAEIKAFTGSQMIYYAPDCSQPFPLSQVHYLRFQGILDASQTIFPVRLEPLAWSTTLRFGFVALGIVGLALTAAVFGVYPSTAARPIAILGLCCTMLFVGVAVGLYHRVGTRAIVFSFDFVFLSVQLSSGLWSTAMLFGWDTRAIALGSMWLWLHWVITIDAWTPLMRQKIGVDVRLVVTVVLVLFVAAQLCLAVELFWRDRWALNDRVVVSLAGRVDLRLLPFFLSRLVMTFLWSLRLLWRTVTSGEGDTIVQIGRVAFKYTETISQPSSTISGVAKAVLKPIRKRQASNTSAAQVAPATTFTPT